MIRALLITTVVSLVVAIVAFTGSAQLGGVGDLPENIHWKWNGEERWNDGGAEFTGDPGQRTSRDFTWDGDDSLEVNVPGEVIYTQGPVAKVTITAPQAVLDRIKIEDGEISRTGSRMNFGGSNIVMVVQAPGVREFNFNGGQKVSIRGYAHDTLEIESNGAADIIVEGAARTVDLRMNGAGNADLRQLANEEAKVELNGASNASLAPKMSVDIAINGVGTVSLATRPPRFKQQIHGLGSVDVEQEPSAVPGPSAPKADTPEAASPAPKLPATST